MEFKKIAYFVVSKKSDVFMTADGKWTTNFNKAKAFEKRKDAITFISSLSLRKASVTEVQDWWIIENNQMTRSGSALIQNKNHG
tara:strand:+ start:233 stop:484 length:252 start_codon:yes stop_codon:yes gene_type:complete